MKEIVREIEANQALKDDKKVKAIQIKELHTSVLVFFRSMTKEEEECSDPCCSKRNKKQI